MWHYALVLLIAVSAICFFYRDVFASGFDLLLGDAIDARLNLLLADSWNDYFNGELLLRQARIFYPYANTRGYTDLNLSLYLLQQPWCLLGFDYIHSAQITYGCLLLIGILSMFYLCRLFNISFLTSIFCALMAFFNNAFWLKQLHTQFFFISLVPLLGICVFRYLQYFKSPRRTISILYASCGCLIFATISYSNFYSAYFIAMWLVVFMIVLLLVLQKSKMLTWKINKKKIWEIIGIISLGIILHLPFIYIYAPTMVDYKRSWFEVAGGLPVLIDVLNFGQCNFLWGELYQHYFPSVHKYFYEQTYGFTPITFLCLILLVISVILAYCRSKKSTPIWVTTFLITLLILNVVIIKILPNTSALYPYTSLWYGAYEFLPGASAIRSMTRIYVFFMFAWVILLGWFIDKTASLFKKKYSAIFILFVGIILLADNFSTAPACNWRYSENLNFTTNIPAPPPNCQVFFIVPSEPEKVESHAQAGLDAWTIARQYGIYTINGYSGNFPPEIHPYNNKTKDHFLKNMISWIKKYNLQNVYIYNADEKYWNKVILE